MTKPVLVVDDPSNTLAKLAGVLAAAGYQVTRLPQEQAIEAFGDIPPEIVLVQLAQGGGSGVTLTEQIRQRPDGAIVPIIFLGTGNEMVTSVSDALAVGGDYYFQHPIDNTKVVAKIRAYIGVGETEAEPPDDELTHPMAVAPSAPMPGFVSVASRAEELEDLDFFSGAAPSGGDATPLTDMATLAQAEENAQRRFVEEQVRQQADAEARLSEDVSDTATFAPIAPKTRPAASKAVKPLPPAQALAQREAEDARLAEEEERQAADLRRALEDAARVQSEAQAKREEDMRRELEDAARIQHEADLRREAQERQQREAQARQQREEQTRIEAEEAARREREARAQKLAEDNARIQRETQARIEAEDAARRELEARVQKQAEDNARRDMETRLRREAEERIAAEERAAQQEQERLRAEEALRKRIEDETRARIEGELRAEAQRRMDGETQRRAEAERIAREREAELQRLQAEEAERRRKDLEATAARRADEESILRRQREAADARAKEERLRIEEADAKRRVEQTTRDRIEAELRSQLAGAAPETVAIADLPATADPRAPVTQSGDFASTDIAIVFAHFIRERITGKVRFSRSTGVEKLVGFEDGRPVELVSADPSDRLEEFLLREHLLTRPQYQACRLKQITNSRQLGAFVVSEGYLKPQELFDVVRRHFEDSLHTLFDWEAGTYTFVPTPVLPEDRIVLPQAPERLIADGIKRRYLLPRLLQRIGGPSSLLVAKTTERPLDLGLDPRERQLHKLLDGSHSIEDLVFSTGMGEERVYQVLFGFVVFEMAEVVVRGIEGNTPADPHSLGIDRARIKEQFDHAKSSDYFDFLGLDRKATEYEVERAIAAARRAFAPERFVPDIVRELGSELKEIDRVLADAEYVLKDARLREAYVRHVERTAS